MLAEITPNLGVTPQGRTSETHQPDTGAPLKRDVVPYAYIVQAYFRAHVSGPVEAIATSPTARKAVAFPLLYVSVAPTFINRISLAKALFDISFRLPAFQQFVAINVGPWSLILSIIYPEIFHPFSHGQPLSMCPL